MQDVLHYDEFTVPRHCSGENGQDADDHFVRVVVKAFSDEVDQCSWGGLLVSGQREGGVGKADPKRGKRGRRTITKDE